MKLFSFSKIPPPIKFHINLLFI